MISVERDASELLVLARALVGEGDPALALPLLAEAHEVPEQIGPTAMGVLQRTLARGCVRALVRRGGWRPATHIDGRGLRRGRLWERHEPVSLPFGVATWRALRWAVSRPLAKVKCPKASLGGSVALGDELVLYLLSDLGASSPCAPTLGRQRGFASSVLCRLGFADLFAHGRHDPLAPEALDRWFRSPGVALVEALQPDLARQWVRMERSKRLIRDRGRMQDLGRLQAETLGGWLDACERHGREDLAGFIGVAAQELLAQPVPPATWTRSLDVESGTLMDRADARRAAGAYLGALDRVRAWDEARRAVRFFEDGYEVSQHLLGEWEALHDGPLRHAAAVRRELERPLAATHDDTQDGSES